MRKRRLLYVPGLVSLLGLPVLLLIWGPEDPVYPRVMKLNLPSEVRDSGGMLRFNRQGLVRMMRGKKIEELRFWDRPSRLHPEYNYYRESAFLLNEMARQQFTHDTMEVLRVHFDEWNDYGDFVWMMDNARIFYYKRYALLDDDLYLFSNPPPPPPSTEKIEPLFLRNDDVVINPRPLEPPTSWELLWRRLSYQWGEFAFGVRRNWWFCAGFILLIVLPALAGMRYKRKPA